MARTLTVHASERLPRRVAQVRAGQTTIEEPAPASPLEQYEQVVALLNSPTPAGYSQVLEESQWRALAEAELRRLEGDWHALRARVEDGEIAINARAKNATVPSSWREKLAALENELYLAETRYKAKLSQYERQLGRPT